MTQCCAEEMTGLCSSCLCASVLNVNYEFLLETFRGQAVPLMCFVGGKYKGNSVIMQGREGLHDILNTVLQTTHLAIFVLVTLVINRQPHHNHHHHIITSLPLLLHSSLIKP